MVSRYVSDQIKEAAMLRITNFKEKNMKKTVVAAMLALSGTASAEVVPGGVGSPSEFPSGLTVSGTRVWHCHGSYRVN